MIIGSRNRIMERAEVLKKLNDIFRDIFDNEELVITEETTPADIEDWDSLGHVYLTVEIDDEFGITLDDRMGKIETVSDVLDLIMELL